MPAAGQTTPIFHSPLPARVEFAQAMRDLCKHAGRSHAVISGMMPITGATFSAYLSARRLPDRKKVQNFYKVIEGMSEAASADRMPHTLLELQALRDQAAIKHCGCCPEGWEKSPSATSSGAAELAIVTVEPAIEYVLDDAASRGGVPVPLEEGDRHLPLVPALPWPALTEITQYLAAGQIEDARVIMRHAGTSLLVDEVPDAVGACRAAELNDVADAILHHAGRRSATDVLQLTRKLNSAGRYYDVDILLDAAVPAAG